MAAAITCDLLERSHTTATDICYLVHLATILKVAAIYRGPAAVLLILVIMMSAALENWIGMKNEREMVYIKKYQAPGLPLSGQ